MHLVASYTYCRMMHGAYSVKLTDWFWGRSQNCEKRLLATDGYIIRLMRVICWILKATDTHSEYVVLVAFQRQRWLRECAWMLGDPHNVCLVYIRDRECLLRGTHWLYKTHHFCSLNKPYIMNEWLNRYINKCVISKHQNGAECVAQFAVAINWARV